MPTALHGALCIAVHPPESTQRPPLRQPPPGHSEESTSLQDAELAALVYPVGQGLHALLALWDHCPAAQRSHLSLSAANWPAGHEAHAVDALASSSIKPVGQGTHESGCA